MSAVPSRCYLEKCRDRLRSEEHTSELQSRVDLVCRLLLEKKKRGAKADLAGESPAPRFQLHDSLAFGVIADVHRLVVLCTIAAGQRAVTIQCVDVEQYTV